MSGSMLICPECGRQWSESELEEEFVCDECGFEGKLYELVMPWTSSTQARDDGQHRR
jgi:uncharacterized Zn ribbon protein